MTVTKQQVIAALAEQRVNRPRRLADQNIRNLLRTYAGGATNIGELNPELYFAVFVAAGALGPVCAPVQRGREPCDNDRTPAPHVVDPHGSLPRPSASAPSPASNWKSAPRRGPWHKGDGQTRYGAGPRKFEQKPGGNRSRKYG